MKTYKYLMLFISFSVSLTLIQCTDADDNGNVIGLAFCDDTIQNGDEEGVDCGGSVCEPCLMAIDFTGIYVQEDQMGRPGINTVFGTTGLKDSFNRTLPSAMQASFQAGFETNLRTLNPMYTTNTLGLDAAAFTTLLSNDVLWVARTGVTTYFNGTEIMTGRNLSDDVIDVSLQLIFGGPAGTDNPTLTSDSVPANDGAFSTSFPYVASPFTN